MPPWRRKICWLDGTHDLSALRPSPRGSGVCGVRFGNARIGCLVFGLSSGVGPGGAGAGVGRSATAGRCRGAPCGPAARPGVETPVGLQRLADRAEVFPAAERAYEAGGAVRCARHRAAAAERVRAEPALSASGASSVRGHRHLALREAAGGRRPAAPHVRPLDRRGQTPPHDLRLRGHSGREPLRFLQHPRPSVEPGDRAEAQVAGCDACAVRGDRGRGADRLCSRCRFRCAVSAASYRGALRGGGDRTAARRGLGDVRAAESRADRLAGARTDRPGAEHAPFPALPECPCDRLPGAGCRAVSRFRPGRGAGASGAGGDPPAGIRGGGSERRNPPGAELQAATMVGQPVEAPYRLSGGVVHDFPRADPKPSDETRVAEGVMPD